MEQDRLDALLQPEAYPEPTSAVHLLQTHISWLFLTDNYVYKFKKPVNFGFLDFTTLEKRCFYCNEEVRLNRRLSPDIYLGVAELRRSQDGQLAIDGAGETVDYAVKMVRLPEQRMMARLLEEGKVAPTDISAIARLVARFHHDAARGDAIDRFGSVEIIRANWEENLRQATAYLGRTITNATLLLIRAWVMKRLDDDHNVLDSRIAAGYIRECDGDLHTENICLDDTVHIFDCIEFNEKFRFGDTAADVAFLMMDLENHGRRDLADHFVNEYIAASGDSSLRLVLPLYLANRAFIRGKVESFRLDDPGIPAAEKCAAAAKATRFFSLSRGYTLRERLPCSLFVTCGPTGSGKSALAAELAFQLGLDHLSTDAIRKQLAGRAATERCTDIYTAEWNRMTYEQLECLAGERLAVGNSVVADGTFIRRSSRNAFAALAKKAGCRLIVLNMHCPPETIRQRLEARERDPRTVSDGTWEVYERQTALIETPDAAEGTVIHLDANFAPAAMVEQILGQLQLI